MGDAFLRLTNNLYDMGFMHLSEDALREMLNIHHGNVDACIEFICDNPSEVAHVDITVGNVSVPPSPFFLRTLGDNFTKNNAVNQFDVRSDTRPSTVCCHPDKVKNGDCAFYSLGLMLLQLYNVISSSMYASYPALSGAVAESLAAQIRIDIFQYIESNWANISLVSGLTWWETMKLAHYSAIPESEKDEHGDEDWGNTAEVTLVAWKAKRDDFYASYVEMNAFVEMVWKRDKIPLVIRQWRKVGRRLNNLGISTLSSDLQFCVVADMLHSGTNDTNEAHWQLMNSGSFLYVKKKKTEKNDDPEWQPTNKRKQKSKPYSK